MRRAAPLVVLLALGALLLAGAAAVLAPVPWATSAPPSELAALVVGWAVALVLVETVVVHTTVGRQTTRLSLSEVPLVLGLVLAEPAVLVLAQLVAAGVVHGVVRRPTPLKAVVNGTLSVAEVLVAVAVFAAVTDAGSATGGPWLWAAGYAAALTTVLLSHALVHTACVLVEGLRLTLRPLVTEALAPLGTTLAGTTLALVAVHALRDDPRSAVLLVLLGALVLGGHRRWAALVERHGALERLHDFSRAVSATRHSDEVLRSVLEQARALLQADYAAVHLDALDDQPLVVELAHDGVLSRRALVAGDDREGVLAAVRRSGRPLLLTRDVRDPLLTSHLRSTGRRGLVVAPLLGPRGPVGLLLAGDRRESAARGFARDDLRLLETVASHAGAALQSGRLLERLHHDARHDALTGLANRAALLEAVAAARPGQTLALLLLDIDGFRQVNDGLGHAAGDVLLRSTAERLLAVVPPGALAARLSGDEFAVLLPEVACEEEALTSARGVREALTAPMTVAGVTLAVAASAGLALRTVPDRPGAAGSSAEVLLQHADLALSEARADGDPDVRLHRGSSGPGADRLALAVELRAALEAGALEVHVQPKAALRDGTVVGVEALARWTHPVLGPVYPDVFIPLAERTGLIVPLTSFVLRTSVAAAARWHRSGQPLHVAVNLSPRSLSSDAVVDEVLDLLAAEQLPPHLLTLEVTEGSVIAEPERAERLLQRLRDAGVRLSLDDFGTGYSSLTHLKRLPVDEVKIDRSFVRDMAHDDDDAAIVRSIVDLGAHLRLAVVAEGVEDQGSWELLDALGCELAQGYHLSRPLPLEAFDPWLAAHRADSRTASVLPRPRPSAEPARGATGAEVPR